MGMASSLILVANPGSASRKYALYEGERERAGLHFEWEHGKVVCTLHQGGEQHVLHTDIADIVEAANYVVAILRDNDVLQAGEQIEKIGLRVVAPSSYFLEDHVVDDDFVSRLEDIKPRAPIHITATLEELHRLRSQFANAAIAAISDSAFHATKPDYAWNYGISLEDADRFEIKRFGYHGLSAASVVRQLDAAGKLPPKLIVCHLGSGASVTAILHGKSFDNTIGYSPLEGVVMSTRSGNIDATAVRALRDACHFDDDEVEDYLNNHSGLLGLGGSSDTRELLRRENDGDNRSRLALATYVYSVQKAIGQMAAALGGADALIFTGTVGERSALTRERIAQRLHYLDLTLDKHVNTGCEGTKDIAIISRLAHSKPIMVVPAQEAAEIVRHTLALHPR
jgi:acetate kinase